MRDNLLVARMILVLPIAVFARAHLQAGEVDRLLGRVSHLAIHGQMHHLARHMRSRRVGIVIVGVARFVAMLLMRRRVLRFVMQ